MQARLLSGIADLPAAAWNRLAPPGNPFLSAEYLGAMEASRSAATKTGWQPLHIVGRGRGRAGGRRPALRQGPLLGRVRLRPWLGRRLSPRRRQLLPQAPGRPCRSRRCPAAACSPRTDSRASPGRGPAQTLEQLDLSSLHVTFCTAEEAEALRKAGFLVRRGIQYHWENRGYGDFDDFLDSPAQRQEARWSARSASRSARRASSCEALHGEALSGQTARGVLPVLPRHRRQALGQRLPDPRLLPPPRPVAARPRGAGGCLAQGRQLVGGRPQPARRRRPLRPPLGQPRGVPVPAFRVPATTRRSSSRSATASPRVEAGAQGIHKLHRGYAPVWTWSAHLIPDPSFRDAVARFLEQETRELEAQMPDLEALLPYRREGEAA